jgi:hypothetical protein
LGGNDSGVALRHGVNVGHSPIKGGKSLGIKWKPRDNELPILELGGVQAEGHFNLGTVVLIVLDLVRNEWDLE